MGIESIFMNHIRTDEKSRNVLIHPIVLKASIKVARKRLSEYFNSNNYFNVDYNEEYNELYTEQYPYEITCYLSQNEATTVVNILFYNIDGKRKRRDFIGLLENLRENLSDILDSNN